MSKKTKNLILAILVTIVTIYLPAFILNKWIEATIFLICHSLIRPQFKKQYHHILHSICRLITGCVFFFGVSFVLPFELSLISAIPINYLIGWVGFTKKQADEFEIKYLRLKEKLEERKSFSTDNCTERQLIDRCRELNFSEEQTNIAIEFFIKRTPRKVLAEKYCIEADSVKKRKQRMKTKLNFEE